MVIGKSSSNWERGVTDMMQERTVVNKLGIAYKQNKGLGIPLLEIFWESNGLERWDSSEYSTKDDLISLLLDLSLLGYYVSEVKTVRFCFDYIIQVRLSKSEKFRTNLNSKLMEQICHMLDRMEKARKV